MDPREAGRGAVMHTPPHTFTPTPTSMEQNCNVEYTHILHFPPSNPSNVACSISMGKETDKSKWTYCRNRPWRSFHSGPPYSHWDTWRRENETQTGEKGRPGGVKDTEGKEGRWGGEEVDRGGKERDREQRDEGLETAQSTNYRERWPAYYDISTIGLTQRQLRQHSHEGHGTMGQDI